MNDDTSLFDVDVVNAKLVKSTLDEVALALKERGYDPVKQIVGYLISGDPGYISNYKNSRNKIQELDRALVVANLLKDYLKWEF